MSAGTDWLGVFIGTLLGGTASLVITHLYFVKGKGLQRLTQFLTYNIEMAMLPNIYTNYFNSSPKIHLRFDTKKKKEEHPHLSEFILPVKHLAPGEEYTALFRVSDFGMDFYMAEHTNAIFSNEEINVKNEVFGFMSMPIKIPKSASKSKYFLEFKFIDAKGNAGAHSICFYPVETDSLKTKGVFYSVS